MIKLTLPASFTLLAVISLSACSSNSGSDTAKHQTAVLEEHQEALVAAQVDEPRSAAVNDGIIEYLRIKHHMVECEGFQVSHCLLVQKEGRDEWTFFYDQIEGFAYQWGYTYEILVQVQSIDTELADASQQQFSLIEVITTTVHESGDAFSYTSRRPHERITEITPGQFSLLGNKAFTCTEESCGGLRSAIAQNHSALLSFQHSTNPVAPLMLNAVLCTDASASFEASCL